MSGDVPIILSAGHAVRFLRERWRFALLVGLIGAAAQTAVLFLLAGSAFSIVLITIMVAAIHAAFVSAALTGPAPVNARLVADAWRVWTSMAIVGFFMFIVLFVGAVVAMSVLISPYSEEVIAAKENPEALQAIFQRAMDERPVALLVIVALLSAVWLWLTSRFYLAAPASVEQQRVVVFSSWIWTRNNGLRISAARLLALAPAYALWFSVQAGIGAALGQRITSPWSLMEAASALAQNNPGAFALFVFAREFVNISLYGALEAGLSVYLYRGLKTS